MLIVNWFKSIIRRLKQPTPVFWRLVGDALLLAGSSGAIDKIFEHDRHAAIAYVAAAAIGKFLTSLPVDKKGP